MDQSKAPLSYSCHTGDPTVLDVVRIVKERGHIVGYGLSDGRKVTKDEGIALARENKLRGVTVVTRSGTEYLRSMPDGDRENNLGNLPAIKQ